MNESIGLQFQLPRNFDFIEGEELRDILGWGASVLALTSNDLSSADLARQLEDMPAHDMYAIDHFTGSNVQVIIQRLPRATRNYTSSDALDVMVEGMTAGFDGDVSVHSAPIRIGNYNFYAADLEVEIIPGFNLTIRMLVRLDGRNMIAIAVTASSTEIIDEILTFFQNPHEPRIYIPELATATADEVVGTWLWDVDESYTLTFNADGTGIRGFSFQPEEFEWTIVDGTLYIDLEVVSIFGATNEQWIAIVDGDILSIENIVPGGVGLAFNYIRE